MKRRLGIVCAAIACSAIAATAQMDKKMDDTVTVTGCVARGNAGYMLNNASMAGGMMMDKMANDTMAMGKETMAMAMEKSPMLSYALAGGRDLKGHVGHKVEIVGTLPKAMAQMGREPIGKDMKPATLTVKSLKMISTSCH